MTDWRQMLAVMAASSVLFIAEAAAGERCIAMVQGEDGGVRTVQMPDFAVAGTAAGLVLPPEAAAASAILCGRDALYMSDDDYRVLTELRIPFAFSDGDRVVWLYVQNLRLVMHMDEGELSAAERTHIEAAITRAQTIMTREGW